MAGRRPSALLTDAEHRIMRVLWDHPRAAVSDVVERVEGEARPAYTSVLTMLRILERKGYVTHEKAGRAFLYSAVVGRHDARRGVLAQIVSRFFDGSRAALVADLLGHERVDAAEVRALRAIIDESISGKASRGGRASRARR